MKFIEFPSIINPMWENELYEEVKDTWRQDSWLDNKICSAMAYKSHKGPLREHKQHTGFNDYFYALIFP